MSRHCGVLQATKQNPFGSISSRQASVNCPVLKKIKLIIYLQYKLDEPLSSQPSSYSRLDFDRWLFTFFLQSPLFPSRFRLLEKRILTREWFRKHFASELLHSIQKYSFVSMSGHQTTNTHRNTSIKAVKLSFSQYTLTELHQKRHEIMSCLLE